MSIMNQGTDKGWRHLNDDYEQEMDLGRTCLCRRDNRWTIRVTEWYPKKGRRNWDRQGVRWRDEIRAYAGSSWSSLPSERGGECWERPLYCSGLAMAEYDDEVRLLGLATYIRLLTSLLVKTFFWYIFNKSVCFPWKSLFHAVWVRHHKKNGIILESTQPLLLGTLLE